MKPLKAILVDDEMHAIDNLKYELHRNCPGVEILISFSDPKEALDRLRSLQFDVLFLDIEMPWLNGFDLLQKLPRIDFEVIFVTAYDQYAINAFRYSAIDYLLKPIRSSDLVEAVHKVNDKHQQFDRSHLDVLLQNLSAPQQRMEKIALPTSSGFEFVKISEIVRCESDGNYSRVFLIGDRSIYLAKTLKDMESLLHNQGFIRVHHSHLISEHQITKYDNADDSVWMEDGSCIPVSRSKKAEFLSRFKK